MAVPSFSLYQLGWRDFQQLCHTVLREILGQTVVSFLDVRDGGRDGAFSGRWSPTPAVSFEGEFVLQCKHTSIAGTKITLSDLQEELDKAERLTKAGRCDIYVLVTNADMTGSSEEAIVAALADRGVQHPICLASTWLNSTIAESSRLRRLVPRLYGLGDLTQILDERAYRQAQAVLDAMRADLSKLVRTGTYDRAAQALDSHGFVLLLGAPATGKTTIAAQLSLGAADDFDTSIVKLDSMGDLQNHWNPDEKQLFWLDDAFGATQFDRTLARMWTGALPRVGGALKAGSRFVLTSRDYVFSAAREHLKPGSFPLMHESQVVVAVSDLTLDERRQILYNHLKLGDQPAEFLRAMQTHLDQVAQHDGFTPELARRLGDPFFTRSVIPSSDYSVDQFFSRPSDFLHDVMSGLDGDARAALGLIFINHNWLPSPVQLTQRDQDLVDRLGSALGGVVHALDDLSGSLVQNIKRDGSSGWVFAHPTMVDAYADLLRTPDLLHHLIVGFPIDVLLSEVTCGDVGVKGAITIEPSHYELVLDRLDAPIPTSDYRTTSLALSRRSTFLSARCDSAFLNMWLDRDPARLERLEHPGLMLTADPENELVARLVEFGLFPESMRAAFAEELIEFCMDGTDPSVVTDKALRSILSAEEVSSLLEGIRTEVLTHPDWYIGEVENQWRNGSPEDEDPDYVIEPFIAMAQRVRDDFPDDLFVDRAAQELEDRLTQWAADREWKRPESRSRRAQTSPQSSGTASTTGRSVFEDLLDGRES